MDEILTLPEIEQRFKSEWVLILDPEIEGSADVKRGRVVFHSKDRDAVHRVIEALPIPRRFAVFFIGPTPAGMEFVL